MNLEHIELARQHRIGTRCDPQLNEGAHDQKAYLDGLQTVQDRCCHHSAVFCEGEGQILTLLLRSADRNEQRLRGLIITI